MENEPKVCSYLSGPVVTLGPDPAMTLDKEGQLELVDAPVPSLFEVHCLRGRCCQWIEVEEMWIGQRPPYATAAEGGGYCKRDEEP